MIASRFGGFERSSPPVRFTALLLLLLPTPLAERAFAAGGAGEIIRPGVTHCGHAKASFVADPLQESMLNGALAHAIEVVIIHVHRIGAFVESDQSVDHGLAAEGNRDLIFLGGSKSGPKHHLGQLLSVSDDFRWFPLALKLRERRAFDELKSSAIGGGRGWPGRRCRAAPDIFRSRMGDSL